MEELLDSLLAECRPYTRQGKVATYIPELGQGRSLQFGHLCAQQRRSPLSGRGLAEALHHSECCKAPSSCCWALLDNGEEVVRSKVGVEATGKPFDAINVTDSPLLSEHLNPMVNMGAIAICTLLKGKDYTERFQRLAGVHPPAGGQPGD